MESEIKPNVLTHGPITIERITGEKYMRIVERDGLQEINIPGVIRIPEGVQIPSCEEITDGNILIWNSTKIVN